MREMVFNNFQKFSSSLGQYLNFSKNSCSPPFVDPGVACGPPFAFDQKNSKVVFTIQTNCFDERNGFRQFSESSGHYSNTFFLHKIMICNS